MNHLQSLPGAWIEESKEQDIDLLKQTIETLRKEKEKLEETNHIVKKSIQIVAEKRQLAEQAKSTRKSKNDEYVLISQEHRPTQEELTAAGIEGWEWVSSVC
ncbi:hypothetical protein BY458DRAFT_502132 [Sporodiniella umbellata]|nr:hypothetical protein BY458DRAFT_502132 [Sporodiniella umbellata]